MKKSFLIFIYIEILGHADISKDQNLYAHITFFQNIRTLGN